MTTTDDTPFRRPRFDLLVPVWLLLPLVVWGSHGFHNVLSRDAALYVYAGQQVAAGEPPYVGVMNRAGPLAHLLPALGVELGRVADLGDVVGARVVFFGLAVVTPLLVHLLARDVFASRLAGSAAAAAMLGYQGFALTATTGPQSKHAMVLFLLVALLLLARRRMVPAGIAAGLATLTWQPALFPLAAAALVVCLTAAGWRARVGAAVRFGVGGLATLVVTVGYFTGAGALDAFLDGFWRANAGYTDQPSVAGRAGEVWGMLGDWFGWSVWLLVGGCAAVGALAGWVSARRARDDAAWEQRAQVLALAAATVAGGGWSLTAFNRAPDTLMLLPLAAVAIGGVVAVVEGLVSRWRWPRLGLVAAVAAWVLVAGAVTLHTAITTRTSDLLAEQAAARAVFSELPDDVTVMSAEAPQPLALTGRTSISRYLLYGGGMTGWIGAQEEGGLAAYTERIRDRAPTVLLVAPTGLDPFLEPLREDYVPVGDGPHWQVLLHASVDPEVRRAVAAAVAAAG